MTNLKWKLHTVKMEDIAPLANNPRNITAYDLDKLKESIDKFGLIDRLVCNTDCTLIGGHQRFEVLKEQKVKKTDVWMPDRLLDKHEVDELCIRLNRNHGEFDFDTLANEFEVPDLLDWGFHADELGIELEEKPQKRQKYRIELEFASLSELESAANRVNELVQDYDNCKMKVKV